MLDFIAEKTGNLATAVLLFNKSGGKNNIPSRKLKEEQKE